MKDHIFCINLNNIDNEVYCDFIVMLTSFQTISSINYAWFQANTADTVISVEGTQGLDIYVSISQVSMHELYLP
jgi:hypothetical protein